MTPIENDRRLGAVPSTDQQTPEEEHREAQITGEVFEGQSNAGDL